MPLIDTMLLRLAQRVDPRTRNAQQTFNDSLTTLTVNGAIEDPGAGTNTFVSTTTAHGLVDGQEVYITGVGGTTVVNNTLANPVWEITVVDSDTIEVPVTFSGAYTSGGTITPARIGSSRGNTYEPQQLLDIYNQARWAAFEALRAKYGADKRTLQREVGALHTSADITFSGASPATAAKPAGYIDFVSLYDGAVATTNVSATVSLGGLVKITTSAAHGLLTGDECTIQNVGGTTEANNTVANPRHVITKIDATSFTIPITFVNAWTSGGTVTPVRTPTIHLVGADRVQAMYEGRPNYLQSATNRHVYEVGANLAHPSSYVTGTVKLTYMGITDFTLTNVLSGTSSETFNNQHLDGILQLGELISSGVGGVELAAIARKIYGVS